jgi:hypothetical protein
LYREVLPQSVVRRVLLAALALAAVLWLASLVMPDGSPKLQSVAAAAALLGFAVVGFALQQVLAQYSARREIGRRSSGLRH